MQHAEDDRQKKNTFPISWVFLIYQSHIIVWYARMETNRPSSNQKSSKKKNKRKDRKAALDVDLDEDELLDQLINENRSIAASSSSTKDETTNSVLKVDSRQLDSDAEIRSLMEKNMSLCGSRKIAAKQHNVRTIGRVIKMKNGWPPLKNTGIFFEYRCNTPLSRFIVRCF